MEPDDKKDEKECDDDWESDIWENMDEEGWGNG